MNEISLKSNKEYDRTVEIYKDPLYLYEYKKLLYCGFIQQFSLTGLKEIKNIYLGLYFREESLKYESNPDYKGHFFNIIYFERNIIFHMNVVINRIATLLCVRYLKIDDRHAVSFDRAFNKVKKEKDFKESKVKDNILKIKGNIYFKTIIDIRKNLEHGIDPYFTDAKMIKVFDIKKIISLTMLCYETIELIYNEHLVYIPNLDSIDIESLKMKRKGEDVFVGLPDEVEIYSDIQEFNNSIYNFTEAICNYVDKVSPFLKSILVDNKKLDKKRYAMVELIFLMISDITFKYNNLIRSFMYGTGFIPEQELNIGGKFKDAINNNSYDYFINISYVMLYSIYDKFGLLLSRIYTTPKNETYFKNITKWILSEDNKHPDNFKIEGKLEKIIDSDYYKMLDRVRQNYIHGYDYMIQQKEGIAIGDKYMVILLKNNITIVEEFLYYLIYDFIPKETSLYLSSISDLEYSYLLKEISDLIQTRNPYFNDKNIIEFKV